MIFKFDEYEWSDKMVPITGDHVVTSTDKVFVIGKLNGNPYTHERAFQAYGILFLETCDTELVSIVGSYLQSRGECKVKDFHKEKGSCFYDRHIYLNGCWVELKDKDIIKPNSLIIVTEGMRRPELGTLTFQYMDKPWYCIVAWDNPAQRTLEIVKEFQDKPEHMHAYEKGFHVPIDPSWNELGNDRITLAKLQVLETAILNQLGFTTKNVDKIGSCRYPEVEECSCK